MSNLSEFWTSFVIWTGRNPTPISRVRQYLAWSGTHPLDVFVFRRYDPSVHDPSEKAHIRAIVELLIPHIKRIRVLYVHCIYSSSLPRPCVDLLGQADILRTLMLESLIDDLVVDTDASPPANDLDTPVLQQLSIKGVHFWESFLRRPSLMTELLSITITDYGMHNFAFPVIELAAWTNYRNLWKITFDNLHLDYTTYDGLQLRDCFGDPDIHFINMSGNVIAEYAWLLDYPCVNSMTFTACTAPTGFHAKSGLLRARRLSLGHFTDEDALRAYLTYDVDAPLYTSLYITDCTALTPPLLRELAGPALPETDDCRAIWPCPAVTYLHIVGCLQVRSADLRAVLEARYEAHAAVNFVDQGDPEWTVAAVENLSTSTHINDIREDKAKLGGSSGPGRTGSIKNSIMSSHTPQQPEPRQLSDASYSYRADG
ncbi:hypothetical protein FOMPIDRAFT_114204 [Fomitopsis schrenkii]|uniref:F-box domain-containing protein n=1 Tax=Fomitopsis schrenkii TaxID=2126942 RepID=S8DXD5_FOMSC|nr:hypothetical protein FOMPIDRAFT_114204 [Fomitopsis schrenkii]